jgi:hypothetical protein
MFSSHRRIFTTAVLAFAAVTLPAHAAVITFYSGSTSVDLNAGTVTTLTGAGITPSAIAPGTLVGLTATFPVVGGTLDTDTNDAVLDHTGGLRFASASSTLDVLNFLITANLATSTGVVTGDVNLNGTALSDVPLFNIGPGLQLTLTSQAAGAFDTAFGVAGLTGAVVGVAEPSPSAVPEPGSILLAASAVVIGFTRLRRRTSRLARPAA